MKIHQKYISRCLELAKKGLIAARPNPSVGCVIVHDDHIIGEGYTSPYGGPHAEVNAIQSVQQQELLAASTLYVSLEPCNHFGKTPPCTDLILAKGLKKVVVGTTDPHAKVAGTGIAKLMASGCEVIVGVLEQECQEMNRRFFCFHQKQRPYIVLKWAQSRDGYLSPRHQKPGEPHWITNSYSRQLVHQWRSEEQAILVGAATVLKDNPSLTVRDWSGPSPLRIILAPQQLLPLDAALFKDKVDTLLFSNVHQQNEVPESCTLLPWPESTTDLGYLMEELHSRHILSLFVEGGAQTLKAFINQDLWDEMRVLEGPVVFHDGLQAPQAKGYLTKSTEVEGDRIDWYRKAKRYD
ncbi:bifunctional diaminohydroxyphosphoribosylaminopyrimidine deaminase/5-amino-6-(5-phosphoribosylamino)uracil reductase RibD [Croceiramulus getboli]|nr:bifunctional diaminohydroxyphosphoribosylaminopyrimidine deaminase/5-amino-6-(5-phosphoribosylamino)uracil reductase RibD [Flavobacteriaceae bacterium YJPT1-3]